MRVLHIEGGRNLYGGAVQVMYLLEGLKARGVENHFACRSNSDVSRAAEGFAELHGLTMRGDWDAWLAVRLFRVIRSVRPDIVHLHSRIGIDTFGGIAARLAGLPAVHSRRQPNPEQGWVVATKYRLHDRVVAISEGIAQVLLSEGVPASKLRVVRSAVDTRLYREPRDRPWLQAEFGLNADSPVIGMFGQLISTKGHRYFLQALPALIAAFPALQVIIFGKGHLEGELRSLADDLGVSGHLHFAGFRYDVPRILPCLDLVVHPSTLEGLGVSLLQASSSGVPIVASAVTGIPEAVHDGVTGLLVPPKDPAALAAAVTSVLSDPVLAKRLGEAGRALMEREFSVSGMVEGNLAVYREVLAERARARI
jgi:glycosyltransferase involved in cell wall biosynthesis